MTICEKIDRIITAPHHIVVLLGESFFFRSDANLWPLWVDLVVIALTHWGLVTPYNSIDNTCNLLYYVGSSNGILYRTGNTWKRKNDNGHLWFSCMFFMYTVQCRYNAVQFCEILHKWCRSWDKISVRCWIHERHYIPRPNRRAMRCL